jgi:hypothetical protein
MNAQKYKIKRREKKCRDIDIKQGFWPLDIVDEAYTPHQPSYPSS